MSEFRFGSVNLQSIKMMMKAQLKDSLRFASTLTFKKLWNIVLILGSYLVARISRNPTIRGLPVSLAIEPTTSCNLRCPECPSGLRSFSRPTGMLKDDFFKKIIDEQAATLSYLTFYFQGEPYLNPSFLDMVHYASSQKIYTSTSTNAHYLDHGMARKTVESGLDRLIISIDGTTQEVYESYRVGGKLDKVLEGTRNVVRWKKELKSNTPFIIFQFLVVKPNEHQMDEVRQMAKDLGVDQVKFKTAQIYNYEEGSPLIPDNVQYSRYRKQEDGRFQIKNALFNHCWKMWHSAVVTWDGKVVPCCFDKDASHRMGNLQTQSFGQVWQSEGYRGFRQSLFRSRKEIDICKNCTEGTKVWA